MGERRFTEALAKGPEEMPDAQSCEASKVTDPDRGSQVVRNVCGNDFFLPGREAAATTGCSWDRVSLAGHAQEFYGAL
jgi:hypothetical protein